MKRFRKVTNIRLNPFKEEIDNKMKGKIKLLGHIGLMLFLVSALMLAFMPAAPVQAATEVTDVWVEFEDADSQNDISATSNVYLVHFKATTALSRGVDTVTVTFPDGTTTLSGTAGTTYAFTLASTMAASEVSFTTSYLISGTSWTACIATPTVGGYRAKVTPPIDLVAGSDVWIKFASDDITSAATAGNSYKVYLSTNQDTTAVLSTAFSLDGTVPGAPTTTVSPGTAGAAAQYKIHFVPDTALTADTHTVTIQFPLGTVLPSSISASNVQFADDADSGYTASGSTPTVDQDKRTVTATTSVDSDGDADVLWVKILSAAGITHPTRASTSLYKTMVRTSVDGQYKVGSAYTISAGAATKMMVCNGNIGTGTSRYSDDATMINMLSSQIFVTLGDANGNAKAPGANVTVTPSSSSATGTFYKNAHVTPGSGAYSTITSITVSTAGPATAAQQVYYKDTAAGTYTLTFTASGYTTATWTTTVAPAVSLYDSSNTLVNTYAATSTSLVAEIAGTTITTQKYGADYINDAITAAMAGDTVKLGDGIYEVDNNSYINLNEAITLTSVNGASSTTLRNTAEIDYAISVGTDGTSTNPIIIDGLTFQRLRAGGSYDIDMAVKNNGYDYVTVRNCIFNYIIPDQNTSAEAVVWTRSYAGSITSSTVSNNTFNNCCGFNAVSGRAASIVFDLDSCGSNTMTGVTISGNTLTDCNDYGIQIRGNNSTAVKPTVVITNNTITNGYSSLNLSDYINSATITGNTITGAYNYGISVEGTNNVAVTIKNNTITGSAGYGIKTSEDGAVVTIQYNAIYDNNTYAIQSTASTQDCKYNWYGSATGPAYTALTGAIVAKSNPNGTGNKISDYVTYYPWLHKSRADVVADNASYQACTIKLVSGWNTLSTPVQLIEAANAIDELISADDMSIGYYYDAGWQLIETGKVLSPCDAVYIKMKSTASTAYVQFKFDAGAFTTPSKDLAAGWNLISLAYLSSSGKDADNAVASVYKTAAGLPGYGQVVSPSINATQRDMYYNTGTSWTYSSGQATAEAGVMYAGLGYWCYMQNAATLAGFEITPIAPDLD